MHPLFCSQNPSKVSDTEKIVQDHLLTLGITMEMISTHLSQGVRSPVITTYRILLHKEVLRLQEDNRTAKTKDKEQSTQRGQEGKKDSRTCIVL